MNRETVQFINNLSAAVAIQSPLPHSHDQGGPTHSHDHGGEHGHTHEHLEHPGKQRVLLLEPKRMSQHWEQANMQNAISPTTGLGIGRKEGLLLASGGEYPLQCPLADTYSYLIFHQIIPIYQKSTFIYISFYFYKKKILLKTINKQKAIAKLNITHI